MRSQAKEPSAGSIEGKGERSDAPAIARHVSLFALLALALAAMLAPTSPALAAGCPNEAVRAEANSLALPDCRGYELVSPAIKDFAVGANGNQTVVAAAHGGAAEFNTAGPMPGATSGSLENPNVARRSTGGWVNRPIAPSLNPVGGQGQYPNIQGYSSDLSNYVFQSENPPLAPGVAENTVNLYSSNTETGANTLLAADAGVGYLTFATFPGASEDFSKVFFEAQEPLLPDAAPAPSQQVYEWSAGQLKNVGILPDGSVPSNAVVGQGSTSLYRVEHAVSDDGRRVSLMAEPLPLEPFGVYQRVDGTSTVFVSESKRTPPDLQPIQNVKGATFWGASSDGGTVLFASPTALTNDATTGENGSGELTDAGNDLYSYDVAENTLTDLTVDSTPADFETGANVQGVVGNSDDGQYVYFVATGKLAAGATSGALNLYQAHGTAIKYIGAMDPADGFAWGRVQTGAEGMTARVSASGDLAIQSVAQLTSYDNAGLSEIYRYSTAGQLTCVSCRLDGSPPVGSATIAPPDYGANVTRDISDDGSRVFFSSTDAILPQDTNEKSDVYEWSEGEVHLISDGTSPFNSTFQDASESGDDVFFVTGARLVGQDTDSHEDLYDARVGGGLAAPPPIPPSCIGEACRTGTSALPGSVTAASSSFQGAPNPTPKKPKKHKKKSKSRKSKTCKSKSGKKCKSANKRTANKSGRGK